VGERAEEKSWRLNGMTTDASLDLESLGGDHVVGGNVAGTRLGS
jgi:hypothetical protein